MKTRYHLFLLTLSLFSFPLRAAQLPCDDEKTPGTRDFTAEMSTVLSDLQVSEAPYQESKMWIAAADTLLITGPQTIERHRKRLDPNTRKVWFKACEDGDLDKVKRIYTTYKVDANGPNTESDWKPKPLHYASYSGRLDVVRYLVNDANADVNIQDKLRNTPLHFASRNGHLDVVRYLVNDAGANVNAQNKDKNNSLHNACLMGHLDIVRFLVNDGNANVNIQNNDGLFWGDTPLDMVKSALFWGFSIRRQQHQAIVDFLASL